MLRLGHCPSHRHGLCCLLRGKACNLVCWKVKTALQNHTQVGLHQPEAQKRICKGRFDDEYGVTEWSEGRFDSLTWAGDSVAPSRFGPRTWAKLPGILMAHSTVFSNLCELIYAKVLWEQPSPIRPWPTMTDIALSNLVSPDFSDKLGSHALMHTWLCLEIIILFKFSCTFCSKYYKMQILWYEDTVM